MSGNRICCQGRDGWCGSGVLTLPVQFGQTQGQADGPENGKGSIDELICTTFQVLGDSTNKFKDASTTACTLVYHPKSANIIRSIQRELAKLKDHSAVPMSILEISKKPCLRNTL